MIGDALTILRFGKGLCGGQVGKLCRAATECLPERSYKTLTALTHSQLHSHKSTLASVLPPDAECRLVRHDMRRLGSAPVLLKLLLLPLLAQAMEALHQPNGHAGNAP